MKKPFSLKIEELTEKLTEEINKSELPAFCLKLVLQGIYNQIEDIEQEEINKYNESLKKEDDKKCQE